MDEKNKRKKEIAKIKEKFADNKIRKEAEKAEKERQQQEIENKKKNENKKRGFYLICVSLFYKVTSSD